jgi:hypothetical protein
MTNFEWITDGSSTKENQTRIRKHVMHNYAQKKRGRPSASVRTSVHLLTSPLASESTGENRTPARKPRLRRRKNRKTLEPQINTESPADSIELAESAADSQLGSDTTSNRLLTPPVITSVTKYIQDPFASTPVKVLPANYAIFQDYINMPRFNKTVREHYDFIHEGKVRGAMEDPLMFLTVALDVIWQRCAGQNIVSTPGLEYVQLQSERLLDSRLSSAFAEIAEPHPDQLRCRDITEASAIHPLMQLIFLHRRYGDQLVSDRYQALFDTLLARMRERLPDSVRLEECTLFGSIVSCEPQIMPKILGPGEARNARKELHELLSCMEAVEQRVENTGISPRGVFCVPRVGFLRSGTLVRQILADGPVKSPWQTLSYSTLNCRFAALIVLFDATDCELGDQFLGRLNQKLSNLKVEADNGSIFTLLIVLLADSEFRNSQRNYRTARILRAACKYLPEDVIRLLSERILTSLVGALSCAMNFKIMQSLELEPLQSPVLQPSQFKACSPGETPPALFSLADMSDPSFGSPVTPNLLNTSTASRSKRLRDYIAYFASHVWYQHPKVDCARDFLAKWGPLISRGEALLYAIAGAAAAHLALTENPTASLSSQDAVGFKTRAMELIRTKVEAEEVRSILTISAIAFLAGSEAFDCGNVVAASSHLKGIYQLIKLRGGLQTLGWQIMEIIYMVDLLVAGMTMSRPHFPFVENPEIAPAIRCKARSAFWKPVALPPHVARLFPPECVELFEQVRDLALFRQVAPTELRTPTENVLSSHPQNIGFLFSYQKLYVEHALLLHLTRHQSTLPEDIHRAAALIRERSASSSSSPTDNLPLDAAPSLYNDAIAKCVQIAMLLFVYMTTSRLGSSTSSALVMTLATNLHNTLLHAASEPSWQQIDVYNLYIWTFFIGALATEQQPLWPWFVDGMTQRLVDFQTISQVREMLREFLYVDDLFDSSLTMMRAEAMLDYPGR